MPFQDFREFLGALRKHGELIDIDRPVALELEVAKALRKSASVGGPAQRMLDAKNVSYIRKSGARSFKITVDHAKINQERETWRGIATLMKKAKPEDVDD